MARPSWDSPEVTNPAQCRRRSAAKVPTGTAISSASTIAKPTNQAVTPNFSAIWTPTCWWVR